MVNNLSTNDLAKLPIGNYQETFITDVRGWVVAHAAALKQAESVWLIGSHETPSKICDHIDRYIIREQAHINDHSTTHELLVAGSGVAASAPPAREQDPGHSAATEPFSLSTPCLLECAVPILDAASRLWCIADEQVDLALTELQQRGVQTCRPQLFQWLRITNFWPLNPADIADKTIPQELDRDPRAISFTKGCYLGQETIARLDARGQLQKKLCLVELTASDAAEVFEAGDKLLAADKEVGHITSLAQQEHTATWRGLALLRRGNFAAGTQLLCRGQKVQVLPNPLLT